MSDSKKTIAVDFDGVLHQYLTPWQGAEKIPDGPVDNALPWLQEMIAQFHVNIFSSRNKEIAGPPAIAQWLHKHGLPHSDIKKLSFNAEKPAAIIYLDDRAWLFEGKFPTTEEILAFRPWNKK